MPFRSVTSQNRYVQAVRRAYKLGRLGSMATFHEPDTVVRCYPSACEFKYGDPVDVVGHILASEGYDHLDDRNEALEVIGLTPEEVRKLRESTDKNQCFETGMALQIEPVIAAIRAIEVTTVQ